MSKMAEYGSGSLHHPHLEYYTLTFTLIFDFHIFTFAQICIYHLFYLALLAQARPKKKLHTEDVITLENFCKFNG